MRVGHWSINGAVVVATWLAVIGTLSCAAGPAEKVSGAGANVTPGEMKAMATAKAGAGPKATARTAELEELLTAALAKQGAEYSPRTRHKYENGTAKFVNRLILEASPYLLQHAHNPVDWWPWGEAAFAEARRRGVPVLLSIGYSTCHWCHVMEEESFEDEEVAAFMNGNYVAIKVDREERPDVDGIYMSAVQAMTGRGGWPMTVWLDHDRRPVFGGTYFAARDGDRGAQTGFLTLLHRLKEIFHTQPDRVEETARKLTETLRSRLGSAGKPGAQPGAGVLSSAYSFFQSRFDNTHGGMSGAPKFPSSMPVRFLLREHLRTGEKRPLEMALLSLRRMADGGMYDHVAGGFHRYSTDAIWLVPHFEKMLYDNALLAVAYTEAFLVSGDPELARVAREILIYVGREMTSADGGFYSATDADSIGPGGEREEGYYFSWTPKELKDVLGADAELIGAYYGVTEAGNFEGRNLLHVAQGVGDFRAEKLDPKSFRATLESARERLYAARARREAPLRDDKILASWNGLMISAFATAGLYLDQPDFIARAERAADFLLTNMRKDGRLSRSFKDGAARHNAYLDDYAFVVAGLLDLYEATGAGRWLEAAIGLDAVLAKHFEDAAGGYFMVSDDHEELLAREKPGYDGAEPSGNSIAVENLVRLSSLTSDDAYRKRADAALQAFASTLGSSPGALSAMLPALDFRLGSAKEVVIVAPSSRAEAEPFLAQLRTRFAPRRVLAVVVAGKHQDAIQKLAPLVAGKLARGGKTTAYVCVNQVCDLPTTDPAVFARQLVEAPKAKGGG